MVTSRSVLVQASVQKLLDAARKGGFQAVQQAITDLIADGWLVCALTFLILVALLF